MKKLITALMLALATAGIVSVPAPAMATDKDHIVCGDPRMLRDRHLFAGDNSAIIQVYYAVCKNTRTDVKWVRNRSMILYYNFILDSNNTRCGPSLFRGFHYENTWSDRSGREFVRERTLDCENDTRGRLEVNLNNMNRLFFDGNGRELRERPTWHAQVTMKWDLGIPDITKEFTDTYSHRLYKRD